MLIAGNWKMNTDIDGAADLAYGIVKEVGDPGDVAVAVCPPATNLWAVAEVLTGSFVRLGAQNMHFEDSGAYTGEVSGSMLRSVGCHYVILGHSERRQYFGETDDTVNRKVRKALEVGLAPIMCVGEHLDEREAGRAQAVVTTQVEKGLSEVQINHGRQMVIAYEPVWAIGTGRTATPEQAQEMHRHIRTLLRERFGDTGNAIDILYGGSMKPENAEELLGQVDVDGGLIGGASLKADSFGRIVRAAGTQN